MFILWNHDHTKPESCGGAKCLLNGAYRAPLELKTFRRICSINIGRSAARTRFVIRTSEIRH